MFTVTLSQPSALPVSVDYQTRDLTATTGDADYDSAKRHTHFPSRCHVTDNRRCDASTINASEMDEMFEVVLSNPVAAVIADDTGVGTITDDGDLGVPPTFIQLDNLSINENRDTSIADLPFATLSAEDMNLNDSHVFTLAAGSSDDDNHRFVISGNQLFLKQGEQLDAETQSSFAIRLQATDSFGLNLQQPVMLNVNDLVEVDDQDVVIADGSGQRSRVESVSVRFDGPVTIQPNAFVVNKRGAAGGPVGVNFSMSTDAQNRTIANLTFDGSFTENGSLVDGNYDLRIDSSKVTNAHGFALDANRDGVVGDDYLLGDEEADDFYRHYGDDNGDGQVNLFDFAAFRAGFGRMSGQAGFPYGLDANADDRIDLFDFALFRASFGSNRSFE